MLWDTLFSLTNAIAVAGWLVLLLAPRKPLANSFVLFAGVGLLCLLYTVMLALLIGRLVDPGAVPGSTPFDPADYSIEGLRRLFMSDAGIVAGWTHYLAFDLFAGLWIAREADRKGVSRWVQTPILLLTFLAGPAGLLIWLILRERGARRQTRA
jgi:uncharacterized protein YhhL (DUF1145 family)